RSKHQAIEEQLRSVTAFISNLYPSSSLQLKPSRTLQPKAPTMDV
ncbi:unnamed protein product, partial [Brassica rapa]